MGTQPSVGNAAALPGRTSLRAVKIKRGRGNPRRHCPLLCRTGKRECLCARRSRAGRARNRYPGTPQQWAEDSDAQEQTHDEHRATMEFGPGSVLCRQNESWHPFGAHGTP
jgi:hypothetical protein